MHGVQCAHGARGVHGAQCAHGALGNVWCGGMGMEGMGKDCGWCRNEMAGDGGGLGQGGLWSVWCGLWKNGGVCGVGEIRAGGEKLVMSACVACAG